MTHLIRCICFVAVWPGAVFYGPVAVFSDESLLPNLPNPQAVAEIGSGRRTVANAAWWGFDAEDATETLQQAIDSGAAKVVVPYMGQPWILRPVRLRKDLELSFEPGVLVLAKQGEFRGGGDSLFSAIDVSDVRIRGYGATLRMRKKDYQREPYEKAEWRMGLRIMGCRRVTIEGLRVESSGGDGIYIGSSGKNRWCEDIVVRNCVCDDNHRQGISVISAVHLLIENCRLSRTDGTPPEAGIDFEPDSPDERLVNCVVRNCVFEHNSGHAILVYLKPLGSTSEPVSIRFENCVSRMGKAGMSPDDFHDSGLAGWSGMSVGAARDDGPQGLVEFVNCTAENTGREGAKVFDKSADSVKVRFVNCNFRNAWVSRHREFSGPRVPILIHLRRPELTRKPGGVEFVNCHVYDDTYGPAVQFEDDSGEHSLHDISGRIVVHNHGTRDVRLGRDPVDVSLETLDGAE